MGSKEVLILGSSQCSKKMDVDLIIMALLPKELKKKKKKGTHALINMSHIINMHTIFNESKTRISHEHDINVDHIECDNGCTLIQAQIVRTRGGSANMGWTTSLTM